MGSFSLKGGVFFELQMYERVGFHWLRYLKGRYRNLLFWSVKRPRRANRCIFTALKKSRKCSRFVLYSYLEQLKGKKSSKGVPFRRVGGVVRGVRTNPLCRLMMED